ncbi:MAG: hypothetical protein C0519_07475 [Hyphomicrobium sp.]|nr:hypothetical protein [Hyphomicrobium sp.]
MFFDADAPERAVATPAAVQPSVADDAAWDWNGDDLSPKLPFDPWDGAVTPGHPNYDPEWAEFWREACATAERERAAAVEQAQEAAESDARRLAAAAPLSGEIVRTGALPPPETRLWPQDTPATSIAQQMRDEGYSDAQIMTGLLFQNRFNQGEVAAAAGVTQSRVSQLTRKIRERATHDDEFAKTLPLSIVRPKSFAGWMRKQREDMLAVRIARLRDADQCIGDN